MDSRYVEKVGMGVIEGTGVSVGNGVGVNDAPGDGMVVKMGVGVGLAKTRCGSAVLDPLLQATRVAMRSIA